jgi:hypothetical protein
VRNGVAAMFVGAVASAVTAVVTSIELSHQISTQVSDSGSTVPAGFGNFLGGFGTAAGIFGGAIYVGLWIWMALANRGGHNWARVLSSVFFGYAAFSLVATVALSSVINKIVTDANTQNGVTVNVPTESGVVIGANAVTVLVGLVAIILIWQKSAAPFYKWQPIYPMPTWGGPAGPPYGYPMPYPQGPVQPGAQYPGQMPLAPPAPLVPPTDQAGPSPWDVQA